MTPALFNRFAKLTYKETGIVLKEGRQSMLSSRIRKRMRELGIEDPESYVALLEGDKDGNELHAYINAITTNTTQFFREPAHFDMLKEALQVWRSQGKERIRIWCAASSTGEEPYTIAMTVMEALKGKPGDLKILATDIDTGVLTKASAAIYPEKAIASLSSERKNKFFQAAPGKPGHVTVTPHIRGLLSFGRLNLTKKPYPMKGPLDVVLCRNVMIYFDDDTRSLIVNESARLLGPGGILFVGHSEALTKAKSTKLARIGAAAYIKGTLEDSPLKKR